MSTTPSSDATPQPAAPGQARPPRSKVERAVVWTVIGALAVVVALEAKSYFAFRTVHAALLAELEKAETTDYRITKAKVDEILGGRAPDLSKTSKVAAGEELYDVYLYRGLLKERPLCVHYSVQGVTEEREVLEVTSIIPDEIL